MFPRKILFVAACVPACVHLISPTALAQPIVLRLDAESAYARYTCLDPCECMPQTFTGVLSGRMILFLQEAGPLFDTYRIAGVAWDAGDQGTLTGDGVYQIGGEVALLHQLTAKLATAGGAEFNFDSGLQSVGDRAFPHIDIFAPSDQSGCERWQVSLQASPTCAPDCNEDGKLNVNDFICFQSEWRKQTAYGDYNGDGRWNINDFIVYQPDFRKGCP